MQSITTHNSSYSYILVDELLAEITILFLIKSQPKNKGYIQIEKQHHSLAERHRHIEKKNLQRRIIETYIIITKKGIEKL